MPAAPSCFNALTRLVPVVRAETARRLSKAGLPQDRIAEHLGVSQAMISKYLRKTPPLEGVGSIRLVTDLADASVSRALADEQRGAIPAWCPVCESLASKGFSCALERVPKLHECIRQERPKNIDDAGRILENLADAAERIRRLNLKPLLPEVRSNLAMARRDAKSIRDVAAFPGRLIELRGEIREIAPPEFGASTHLAEILLKLRRTQPRLHAIFNLRYGDDVRAALRRAQLRARILPRSKNELVAAIAESPAVDAVIDAGAFGIEPALYVLGESATEVVAKAERILMLVTAEKTK